MIRQFVQNILVYVVMMNILRGLVSDKKFRDIFRFAGGMILILLCVSPVLSVISDSNVCQELLEKKLNQSQISQVEQELKMTEGNLEEIMMKECQKELERQISSMVEQQGEKEQKINVSLYKDKKGEFRLQEVQLELEPEAEAASVQNDRSRIKIDEIEVLSDQERSSMQQNNRKNTDDGTRRMKKKICKKYELSGKKVMVWRKSGNNY